MLALTLIPSALRAARAEGPVIDADVQRLMDEKPDEEHPLIVSVGLCRTPLNIEELLPTPEETNECTRLWRAWELLAEEFEEGCNEQLTQEQVDAAYAEAKAYDEVIVSIRRGAYRAYHKDYAEIVEESVPDVYESLRSVLGDRVRRVSDSSKLLAVRADRAAFEAICATASIKRVNFDIQMGPMLDKSRLNIKADEVNCSTSSTPYTGLGVKVAIVDDGVIYAHPRLPTADTGDERDFSTDVAECMFPGNACSFEGHGTQLAGVIFCEPDENPCGTSGDGFVGIAYEATLVNAKLSYGSGGSYCGPCNENCPPGDCELGDYEVETWGRSLPAFEWAVLPPVSEPRPEADVINYSRGKGVYGDPDEETDTEAGHFSSLYVDWLVDTSGKCFVHSCGNLGIKVHELSPPSGAYNCISVGAYNDNNSTNRNNAIIWDGVAQGPTDDGRRKPDLSAPGVGITTTNWSLVCDLCLPYGCGECEDVFDFTAVNGTSYAAPHATGTIALLLEAQSSLSPRQIHAILVNATDYGKLPDSGNPPQTGWDDQGGFGMLEAKRSVRHRNRLVDDALGPNASETYYLNTPDAGDEVVLTCVWQREMVDEDTVVTDSPGNLDIFLERRPVGGGSWAAVTSSESDVDNVEQVRAKQPPTGVQYDYRIRVERIDGSNYLTSQAFTLASRHNFQ